MKNIKLDLSGGHLVSGKIYDSYNLNITDSACQRGRRRGEVQTKKTNLTQIYKNMPLDSYQQLRTVGALFTEKKAIYTKYLQR